MKGRIAAAAAITTVGLLATSNVADAFCGFYVSGADAKLFNEATQVVLMRDGTRTVLAMQNDYKGPPQDFALVVPVPVVLQKENVKTLSADVFKRLDTLSSPRLVEYWEQDPCGEWTIGHGAGTGTGQGFGSGHGRLGGAHAAESSVKIEAQFEVGEYEIVILSAKDSAGLDTWLRENKYKIPENSEPALKPYVAAGSKFFVAKVNIAKVKMENGHTALSPLRFHYDSEKFELPVKLGLLNSSGTQDLIVHVLASGRYEVANYPNVTIPTNLDVSEAARSKFGEFYTSLFDRTVQKHPNAVVTEYAWSPTKCDPCPSGTGGLSAVDLKSLGADVLPNVSVYAGSGGFASTGATLRQGASTVTGGLPPEVVQRIVRQNFGRFRLCYENGLTRNPNLQGKVTLDFEISPKGDIASAKAGGDVPDSAVITCIERGVMGLTFPEGDGGKKTKVSYPIIFAPGPGGAAGGGGGGGGGPPANVSIKGENVEPFTLTRLHARYTKDSLGQDLVFRSAQPIVGGRETWTEGKLETGAIKIPPRQASAFQARYAIRHAWPGAVSCKEPHRGVWGGRWPDFDAGALAAAPVEAPKSATNLAFAPRGGVDQLASFTSLHNAAIDKSLSSTPSDPAYNAATASSVVPPADSAASPPRASDAGDGDAGAATAPKKSSCGCKSAPRSWSPHSIALALATMITALSRRRRVRVFEK